MTAISPTRRITRSVQKSAIGYLFISVPVISMIVFLFIPMIVSLWWSSE